MKNLVSNFAFGLALLSLSACATSNDWRTATRESAGIAPKPSEHDEAIVQVYAADAWGWRGWFAVHTWIATKRKGADDYTVYDVVGWRQRWRDSVVGKARDIPDRHWFGAKPEVVLDKRGAGVERLIDQIELAVDAYPWADEYTVFPGPNSNTFVAWVGHQVPELELDLPFSAIGSGYAKRGLKNE